MSQKFIDDTLINGQLTFLGESSAKQNFYFFELHQSENMPPDAADFSTLIDTVQNNMFNGKMITYIKRLQDLDVLRLKFYDRAGKNIYNGNWFLRKETTPVINYNNNSIGDVISWKDVENKGKEKVFKVASSTNYKIRALETTIAEQHKKEVKIKRKNLGFYSLSSSIFKNIKKASVKLEFTLIPIDSSLAAIADTKRVVTYNVMYLKKGAKVRKDQ